MPQLPPGSPLIGRPDNNPAAAKLAPKPAPEPPKPAPVEEKIVLITAPPEAKPEIKETPLIGTTVENGESVAPTQIVEAPKIPSAPPKPAGPKVGEKVGFIQLSPRPQPRGNEKSGQAKFPPSRHGGSQRNVERAARVELVAQPAPAQERRSESSRRLSSANSPRS